MPFTVGDINIIWDIFDELDGIETSNAFDSKDMNAMADPYEVRGLFEELEELYEDGS